MRTRGTASIGALLLVTACVAPPRPADVIVFASGADLESANPLVTIHPLSRQVQRHVLFVTLTRLDSALATQPYFARSWNWNVDRTTLCGKTIGIECGCDEDNQDGNCGNPACDTCTK
jgi:peptide/nickel transport system substrate-binding protein